MSMLLSHLEQINLCSQSISELSFPGSRSFANAILANHDITALIRDTESHERALFHLAPPPVPADVGNKSYGVAPISSAALKNRRSTMHPARQPRNKAVAAVLGGDLYARIQSSSARQPGELDVDLLLHGAERLATVYPIAGALDKIAQFRRRHIQLKANIAHYEDRVSEQTQELERMTGSTQITGMDDELELNQEAEPIAQVSGTDWHAIQEEIRDLEEKKKSLEERVTGMEKDLGGLLR